MLAKILFTALLFSSLNSYAKETPVHNLWQSKIKNCTSDAKKLSQNLEEFDTQAAKILDSYTVDQFNQIFTDNPKETEVIKTLLPYMIPDSVAFSSLDKTCYAFLGEFYKLFKDKNTTQAHNQLKAWEGCLVLNYKNTPKTAEQLLQCFKKIKK